MAPKKAAKKVAKKAAKKAPSKHASNKRSQDLRRSYEHFGRVADLLPLIEDHSDSLIKMVTLGKGLLQAGSPKEAADVFRASEHFAFGTLAARAPEDTSLSSSLTEGLQDEYAQLLERADEHAGVGELSKPVTTLFRLLRGEAVRAYRSKKYRAASELARGAEALAHVKSDIPGRLRSGDIRQLEQTT